MRHVFQHDFIIVIKGMLATCTEAKSNHNAFKTWINNEIFEVYTHILRTWNIDHVIYQVNICNERTYTCLSVLYMVQLFDRLLTQVREDVIRLIKYYVLNLGYTFCYRAYVLYYLIYFWRGTWSCFTTKYILNFECTFYYRAHYSENR